MSSQSKEAEEVVKQYARGLEYLDLSLIAPILHEEFKFVYRLINGRGHGIRTDVRYIGHLFKTFEEMKSENLSIKTDFATVQINGENLLCIKLLPPHDRRIIFPMDYQIREDVRNSIPEREVFLIPRVKNKLLCKVECYCSDKELKEAIWLMENPVP